MKRIILLLSFCVAILFNTKANAQWANVGSTFLSTNSARATNIVTNEFGTFTAFIENNKANVKKFNGTNWESVGAADFSTPNTQFLSLAVDGTTPYVTFRDNSFSGKISVMKFDGVNWVFVGTPGFSTGSVQYSKIRISNNIPYVAFQNGATGKASVMRFTGTAWEFVGNPQIGSVSIWNLQFEFNNNTPYLSFREFNAGVNKLNVIKLVETDWVYAGNSVANLQNNSDGSSPSVKSSLAFEPVTNIPFISYIIQNPSASDNIVVTKKLTGTTWSAVGNPINNVFNSIDDAVKLVFYNNQPTAAFTAYNAGLPDAKISVSTFNGTNWVYLDGNVFASVGSIGTENFPLDTHLDLYPYNNELYLSYAEDVPENGKIRIRKFTPVPLSIADNNFVAPSILVYPNPSSGLFTIDKGLSNNVWVIYNNLGQLVLNGNGNLVNLSSFPNGEYFLKINANGILHTKKLLKN